MASATELLRMGELAEASGVPAPTIKHYLREGLLPEGVKTSRNMAYYPPEFVDRIRLIKRLQEERFMPLRAIKEVLDDGTDRAEALLALEDRSSTGRSPARRPAPAPPTSTSATASPRRCSTGSPRSACSPPTAAATHPPT